MLTYLLLLLLLLCLPALFEPQWTGAKADFADLAKMFPDAILQFVGGGRLELRMHAPLHREMCMLT
jgi:hypothetical protein